MLAYYRELPAPDQAAADNHLAACETCRAARTQLVETLGLVDAAPAAEAPPGFERVMWARVAGGVAAAVGPARVVHAALGAGGGWRGRGGRGGVCRRPVVGWSGDTAADRDRRGDGTGQRHARADSAGRRWRSLRSLADGAGRAGQRRPVAGRDSRRRAAPGGRSGVDQPRDPPVGRGRRGRSDGRAARGSRAGAAGSGQRRRREHRRRAGDGEGANRVAGDSVPPPGDHLRRAAARGAAAARRKARRCREARARRERR